MLGRKVVDGAYSTMISRITSDTNPNFFFLTYNKEYKRVNDFLIIPKHFFTLEIIEKRKPLAITARRAGWTGCNINLSGIPALGRIFLIKGAKAQHKKDVLLKWQNSLFLRNENAESKGWTLDVLKCIDAIQAREFSLPDIYKFEDELRRKHPLNNFIQPKIRQQLQILRDKGVLKFVSKGKYLKIE